MKKTTRYEIIGSIERECPLCSHEYSKDKKIYHLYDKLTRQSVWACKECILDFGLKLKKKDQKEIDREFKKENEKLEIYNGNDS